MQTNNPNIANQEERIRVATRLACLSGATCGFTIGSGLIAMSSDDQSDRQIWTGIMFLGVATSLSCSIIVGALTYMRSENESQDNNDEPLPNQPTNQVANQQNNVVSANLVFNNQAPPSPQPIRPLPASPRLSSEIQERAI